MVYPIGFGAGSSGLDGTGFQLLAIIFTEFFGVTLAQLIGALAPSIQVSPASLSDLFTTRFNGFETTVGRDVVQFRDRYPALRVLRCHHSVPRPSELATSMAIRVEPLGQNHQLDAHHRTTVRPSLLPFPLEKRTPSPNHLISISPAASRSPVTRKSSPSSIHLWVRHARLGQTISFNTLVGTWITQPRTRSVGTVPSRLEMSTTPR